jgi:hypothetical protein
MSFEVEMETKENNKKKRLANEMPVVFDDHP